MQNSSHDVVIVGARPAGAATAMLLARRGLDVLVVDRAEYGRDTVSTHALDARRRVATPSLGSARRDHRRRNAAGAAHLVPLRGRESGDVAEARGRRRRALRTATNPARPAARRRGPRCRRLDSVRHDREGGAPRGRRSGRGYQRARRRRPGVRRSGAADDRRRRPQLVRRTSGRRAVRALRPPCERVRVRVLARSRSGRVRVVLARRDDGRAHPDERERGVRVHRRAARTGCARPRTASCSTPSHRRSRRDRRRRSHRLDCSDFVALPDTCAGPPGPAGRSSATRATTRIL